MIEACIEALRVPRQQAGEMGEVRVIGEQGRAVLTTVHYVVTRSLVPQRTAWGAWHGVVRQKSTRRDCVPF
jgi:hypothetical protein